MKAHQMPATTEEQSARRAADRIAELVAGDGAALDAGAEIEILDAAGESLMRVPLARHCRFEFDSDGRPGIWMRPIWGGHELPGHRGRYTFALNMCRRRWLLASLTEIDAANNVLLRSPYGETAIIRPAAADTFAELERWDTFTLVDLPVEYELELDALVADSGWGPYA